MCVVYNQPLCRNLGADPSLLDGKNVVTFSFLYILGKVLHQYKDFFSRVDNKILVTIYIIYNIIIIALFSFILPKRGMEFIFVRLFFSSCSIGLLINALLFFIIISKLKFKSQVINLFGGASLTIYMFHGANFIIWNVLSPIVNKFLLCQYETTAIGECILIIKVCTISLCVIFISTALHYCISPIVSKIGDMVQNKYPVRLI